MNFNEERIMLELNYIDNDLAIVVSKWVLFCSKLTPEQIERLKVISNNVSSFYQLHNLQSSLVNLIIINLDDDLKKIYDEC
jgi:surface polysaccharide O-acyltransferase-like enzyme